MTVNGGDQDWIPAWFARAAQLMRDYWPIAAMPGPAIWAWVVHRSGRHKDDAELQLKREEQEAEDLAERRRRLSADADTYLNRIEAENTRLRSEVESLRIDRDNGWDKARAADLGWHESVHQANSTISAIAGLAEMKRPMPKPLPFLPRPPPLETLPGKKPS